MHLTITVHNKKYFVCVICCRAYCEEDCIAVKAAQTVHICKECAKQLKRALQFI